MPFVPPFAPLAVGAVDSFAFDLTEEAGRATITPNATTWVCVFGGPNGTSDGAAQSRIVSTEIKTTVPTVDDDGNQITLQGVFAAALIGNFPPSSAGGSYGSGANTQHEEALLASLCRLQAQSTAFQTAGAAWP